MQPTATLAVLDRSCSHEYVEPISAILILASARGAGALVRAISGSSDLSELSSDLFKALAESESRIEARLSNIEGQLDKLLDQRYKVALTSGIRFLMDGIASTVPASRLQDFDRARRSFVEAAAAANSSLQQAIAERYLLLSILGQTRFDLIPANLARVESAALAASFDAALVFDKVITTVYSKRRHQRGVQVNIFQQLNELLWGPEGGPQSAEEERLKAATQTVDLCARLLAEASILAPVFNMPARIAPPLRTPRPGNYNWTPWIITIPKDGFFRVGCIRVRLSTAPADTPQQTFTMKYGSYAGSTIVHEALPISADLQLQIHPPLPQSFFVSFEYENPSPKSKYNLNSNLRQPIRAWNVHMISAGVQEINLSMPSLQRQGQELNATILFAPREEPQTRSLIKLMLASPPRTTRLSDDAHPSG